MDFGKGRVVAIGEAAMFTAQISGSNERRKGLNHESAVGNQPLLLNIMHRLDDLLE